MTRALSQAGRASLYADTTNDVWSILLTIKSASSTYRFTSDNQSIVSNGFNYDPYPFTIVLPQQGDENSSASITIGNVGLELVEFIRKATSPPQCTIAVIRTTLPDFNEILIEDLKLTNVTWNDMSITGDLFFDNILTAPFPSGSGVYSPRQFAALF